MTTENPTGLLEVQKDILLSVSLPDDVKSSFLVLCYFVPCCDCAVFSLPFSDFKIVSTYYAGRCVPRVSYQSPHYQQRIGQIRTIRAIAGK
jgi:hypothetical protein